MARSGERIPAALAAMASVIGLSSFALAQSPKKPPGPPAQAEVVQPKGVSKIDRYAKVLGLDKAQTDAARDLYQAYQRDTQSAAKKMHEAMKDAQEDMNAGDRAEFEKRIGKMMEEHTAVTKKLTDSFLGDMKDLLSPAQADRWPSFERYRRREQYLGGMMFIGGIGVGGSSVDLFPIVEKLGVPAGLKPKVDEVLTRYEIDMDHPLLDRQHNIEDEQKQMGAVQRFDGDSFAKKQERDRKVDMAIREVNTTYVRQIASLLPTDLARKLEETYQAKAYRTIYKDTAIAKKLAGAQKLTDLSADQKQQLQALIDKYKRDSRAANDTWAAAQKKAEDAGRPTGGGLLMFGPGNGGGEKIDPDVAAARAAKRELDAAAREQMEKLLTPEQVAAIPQPPQAINGAHAVAMIGDGFGGDIVLDDIDLGDDFEPGAGGGPAMIIRTVEIPVHGGQGGGDGAPAHPAQTAPKP